jgi:precorrin-2 methylase
MASQPSASHSICFAAAGTVNFYSDFRKLVSQLRRKFQLKVLPTSLPEGSFADLKNWSERTSK